MGDAVALLRASAAAHHHTRHNFTMSRFPQGPTEQRRPQTTPPFYTAAAGAATAGRGGGSVQALSALLLDELRTGAKSSRLASRSPPLLPQLQVPCNCPCRLFLSYVRTCLLFHLFSIPLLSPLDLPCLQLARVHLPRQRRQRCSLQYQQAVSHQHCRPLLRGHASVALVAGQELSRC